ncbi:MAG TPA: hypothetical protein VIZ18_08380 [Ktedonobacteraceae bacterium]
MQINELQTVTREVGEAVRENLVTGLAKEDEQMRPNQMPHQGYRRS